MEPARNPLAAPEYSLKQNFANSQKAKLDNVNCSDDLTIQLSSTIEVTDRWWGRTGERKRGKLVYTTQVHNLVCCVLCQGVRD